MPAGLLNAIDPTLALWGHKDYGLPPLAETLACESLFIASSYSGNTEETIDFAEQALVRGYPLAVVTGGGALLTFAEQHTLPLIRLPHDGLPPRISVGAGAIAIAAHLGEHRLRDNAIHI